jgi:hypothetical protein
MCWLFFICRNENINGVGTTGLDFLCVILEGLVNIRIIVAFRVVFLSCFGLDWMRNLHNEHHLAAKSGTVFCLF